MRQRSNIPDKGKKQPAFGRHLKENLSQKKRRISVCLLFLFLVSAALLSACGRDRTGAEGPQYDFGNHTRSKLIILEIKDSQYRNSDFEKYLLLTAGEEYKTLSTISLSRLYDDFVEEKILLESARQAGESLTEQEKADYLKRLEEEIFSEEGSSFEEEDIEFFFERLLIDKYSLSLVQDLQVTDEEMRAYYDQNREEFLKPERVKVSQILLNTEERALAVLERIRDKDEQEFRRTAQEISLGGESQKGGEMGVYEMGQLPLEMEQVIFSLEEGELSDVIESAYGFHIFRLDKKYDPELVSFENAVPAVNMKVMDIKLKQSIHDHIEAQKNSLEWNSYITNLSFPYERVQDE